MTDQHDESLKSRVETWMVKQMPIIQMHGGTSVVREADPDSGQVVVELGGTCSGCGISNITAQNIQRDLFLEFEEIQDVQIKVPSTGDMGADTVEGGRGGDVQFSNESAGHF
jgi:Fe-S cluster biogenesis protein NfuA